MRDLRRNQQVIYFKKFLGNTEIIDELGNHTGSFAPTYGELQCTRISVSPNRGYVKDEMFGSMEEYDRTMSTSNTHIEIDENTVLWIGKNPNNSPYNYIVRKRADGLNSVVFAISKVNVSGDFNGN